MSGNYSGFYCPTFEFDQQASLKYSPVEGIMHIFYYSRICMLIICHHERTIIITICSHGLETTVSVCLNISASAFEERCSGQFFRKMGQKKSGSGANSEFLSPTLSSNNNNFPCLADEDKSVDIVRLLSWRLDHLQQEMAIPVACLRPGGHKAKVSA